MFQLLESFPLTNKNWIILGANSSMYTLHFRRTFYICESQASQFYVLNFNLLVLNSNFNDIMIRLKVLQSVVPIFTYI